MRIIIGMTGASGAVYGVRLIDRLRDEGCEIHAVMSPAWRQSAAQEGIAPPKPAKNIRIYEPENYNVPIASGSEHFDGMVIAPCSGSTLACVASGINRHLIHRAAEVQLKERRRLILLFRESPLSLIHIQNMERVTLAGGIVQIAAPHFYQSPQTVQELADTVITRTMQLLFIGSAASTTLPLPSTNRYEP
ncbi:MAG: UbiX family flavin prenyltransferase [Planctomycetaceae bacterium]|jgi:4-hydroxy-3-polyprenylbenzoate decarboxylase|nr:UbiX family flavin prenyltransferase [Planctomycetaceae bacterium]